MDFGIEYWTHAFAQKWPTQNYCRSSMGHEIATDASVENDCGGCRFEGA